MCLQLNITDGGLGRFSTSVTQFQQTGLIDQSGLMYGDGMTVRQDSAPPGFLRLGGDPGGGRLLTELARSDRQVRELEALIGQPQSLVSYHLGQLRDGGLGAAKRSSANRRDAYYRIDLARCGELLAQGRTPLAPGL